ncbi:SDR family oxidoreductase [Echinicola marina]|uniref:NAD(P)-dependent oxidoreductase n=1 Tax=Echinicola marina TaxID=2859768 RepID=UPI001CF67573|nr:NAD(P)-binding oxidoreductase [Echinicola marina]UCS95526.1 SDR family oxidoreductase [Echinicola marina]
MTVLVVGASGATGRHLVNQLLLKGNKVKIIVRSKGNQSWDEMNNLDIYTASILELSDSELMTYTADCDAIASCLGHNITFKGIYGQPRKLVTDATKRLCQAITKHQPKSPIKYVLMNTSGNSNRDLNEPISFAQKCIIGLLRLLMPPHVDNEQAADYLRTEIGQNDKYIQWVAVRPDGLIDENKVTEYETYPSPTRSAIFNAGKVSRVNVGHFMAELINDNNLWNKWKGQMPVIYSKTAVSNSEK